jgi:hypothetical protein
MNAATLFLVMASPLSESSVLSLSPRPTLLHGRGSSNPRECNSAAQYFFGSSVDLNLAQDKNKDLFI